MDSLQSAARAVRRTTDIPNPLKEGESFELADHPEAMTTALWYLRQLFQLDFEHCHVSGTLSDNQSSISLWLWQDGKVWREFTLLKMAWGGRVNVTSDRPMHLNIGVDMAGDLGKTWNKLQGWPEDTPFYHEIWVDPDFHLTFHMGRALGA